MDELNGVRAYLKNWDDDFGFIPSQPSEPLPDEPGSMARIEALASRFEGGEALWSPIDSNVLVRYCEKYEWVMDSGPLGSTLICSPCRRWIYRQWYHWGKGPIVCFIGQSPSEIQWRRQLAFARKSKFGGIESVNLSSWSLDDEPHDGSSEVGAICDQQISQAVMSSSITVLCWGDGGPRGEHVAEAVLNRIGLESIRVFGLDLAGNPLQIGSKSAKKLICEWPKFSSSTGGDIDGSDREHGEYGYCD